MYECAVASGCVIFCIDEYMCAFLVDLRVPECCWKEWYGSGCCWKYYQASCLYSPIYFHSSLSGKWKITSFTFWWPRFSYHHRFCLISNENNMVCQILKLDYSVGHIWHPSLTPWFSTLLRQCWHVVGSRWWPRPINTRFNGQYL
jgi:hypothetical protein